MVNLEPIALAALADGGAAGILSTAGGALRVALFAAGVEVTGNGYSRKSTTTAASAVNVSGETLVSFGAVTFAAVGGNIAYDQIRIFSRSGHVLYGSSSPGATQTIEPGGPHTVTTQIRFPAAPQIPCNSAAQIQASLTNQADGGTPTVVAAGEFPVSTTLEMFESGGAGWLTGQGAFEPAADWFNMALTALRWAGARGPSDTDPILRYELGRGHLRHIAFRGATVAQIKAASVNKAPVGLLMRRAQAPWDGVGTGKILGYDLYFSYFRTALKLAENLADGNCDECTWRDLQFDRNDICVELSAYQTMGHHFWHPRFGVNPILFNVIAGGDLSLTHALIAGRGSVLFNFPTGSSANFGQNNAGFTTNGRIKIDSQATSAKVVSMAPILGGGYYADFDLQGLHFPSPQAAGGQEVRFWNGTYSGGDTSAPAAAFDISGNTVCHITKAKNLQRGMLAWNTGTQGVTRYVVRDSRIFYRTGDEITDVRELADVDLNYSSGKAHFTFENCFDYNTGLPLADWSGYLE